MLRSGGRLSRCCRWGALKDMWAAGVHSRVRVPVRLLGGAAAARRARPPLSCGIAVYREAGRVNVARKTAGRPCGAG